MSGVARDAFNSGGTSSFAASDNHPSNARADAQHGSNSTTPNERDPTGRTNALQVSIGSAGGAMPRTAMAAKQYILQPF
jgi:hypothetical protein